MKSSGASTTSGSERRVHSAGRFVRKAKTAALKHGVFSSGSELDTANWTSRAEPLCARSRGVQGVSLCQCGLFSWGPALKRLAREVAYEMNGVPVPRDHGKPARAMIPGYAGCRSAKWLNKITLAGEVSSKPWQTKSYLLFPPDCRFEADPDKTPGKALWKWTLEPVLKKYLEDKDKRRHGHMSHIIASAPFDANFKHVRRTCPAVGAHTRPNEVTRSRLSPWFEHRVGSLRCKFQTRPGWAAHLPAVGAHARPNEVTRSRLSPWFGARGTSSRRRR